MLKINILLICRKYKNNTQAVSLKGKGLHTGYDVEITFRPAPVDHGYKFQRIDLEGKPIISASVDNVTDTSRGTTLVENWMLNYIPLSMYWHLW